MTPSYHTRKRHHYYAAVSFVRNAPYDPLRTPSKRYFRYAKCILDSQLASGCKIPKTRNPMFKAIFRPWIKRSKERYVMHREHPVRKELSDVMTETSRRVPLDHV